MCLLQAASFSQEATELARSVTLLGGGLTHFGMEVAPFPEERLSEVRRLGSDQLGAGRHEDLLLIGGAMSAEEAARYALAE